MTKSTTTSLHADAVRLAQRLLFAAAAAKTKHEAQRLTAHRQRVIQLIAETEAGMGEQRGDER